MILTQEVHVRDPDGLWEPAWVGQRTADMPCRPQVGEFIAIGSDTHKPKVEEVTYVVRSGWPHVLLSAVQVHDPNRLGTAIKELQDRGYKTAVLW